MFRKCHYKLPMCVFVNVLFFAPSVDGSTEVCNDNQVDNSRASFEEALLRDQSEQCGGISILAAASEIDIWKNYLLVVA